MMWDWFNKLINKTPRPQRRRVEVDIPFEQLEYRREPSMTTSPLPKRQTNRWSLDLNASNP